MEKRLENILNESKERYRIASEGWADIYSLAREDMRFTYDIGNGQWPEEVRQMRKGRPMITVNKLQKFIRQMRGDFAMNRPSMKVIPVDSRADVRMAELYNGILKQIEYISDANIVYDTAYSGSIASSIGYFRIITKFEDNSFNQDIYLERVINPFSVHFDPYAKAFNLEDAQYCFVEDLMDKTDYKKKYPKSEMINFSSADSSDLLGSWIKDDKIMVCEYWVKEPISRRIYLLSDGTIIPEDLLDTARAAGLKVVREREIIENKVRWYRVNGAEILEEGDWAGSGIPIIPMFGDEVVVDGKRNYLSLIRGAKSTQQMYNFWASSATENVMLTPKTPFIIDHRQIKGFENEWEESNVIPRLYLRYNAIAGLQKPSRESQTQVPSAIINMMQSTAYDIEDHLGRYESSKGEAGNERSGKAIIARINQSDKGTYTFIDNATKSIVAGLRQIVELIPKIYDTKRALVILGEDGERENIEVNVPSVGDYGEPVTLNDLSVGKYDVIATVGASYGSKREEMVKMLVESMQYAPDVAPVLLPFIYKNSDWPGAQEVYQALVGYMQQQQQPNEGVK